MKIAPARTVRDRTPFIGRTRELSLLQQHVEGSAGLLTLAGPSGIGKTRLAMQLAGSIATSTGARGVWFCKLAGCSTAADLEGAVARTLGIPDKQGETLTRAIAGRGAILLILDNLDAAAVAASETLGSWIDLCDELQLIATSIVPTGLEGEILLEVGPLEPDDAVSLYMERAQRAWAGRRFLPSEMEVIEELVGRLDRIPLAIELAAARIRVLPPKALLARMGQRFEVLRNPGVDRHGSLLEALSLTWDLLHDEEKELLAKAAVFEEGFTHEAAARVLGADAEAARTVDLLDGLRSKALLQFDDAEPARFQLFESVKEFGYRELERSGHLDETLRRHEAYFLSYGEAHAATLDGEEGVEGIRHLKAERGNILAVHQRNIGKDPAVAARAGLVLVPIFLMEGYPAAGSKLAETTVAAARRSEDSKLILRALEGRFRVFRQHGKVQEAMEDATEAIALAREVGDRAEEAMALVHASSLYVRRGELSPALPLLDLAVRISREEGVPLAEGMALMIRGEAELGRQSLEAAAALFDQSIRIFRSRGFVEMEALALSRIGIAWSNRGLYRDARRALHQALSVSRRMDNRSAEASILANLGNADLAAGLHDSAEDYLEQALHLYRQVGNRIGEGIAGGNIGILQLVSGDLDKAESRLAAAEAIMTEAGVKGLHAEILSFIAALEARRGNLDEAKRTLDRARAYFESVDDRASLERASLVEGVFEIAEARVLGETEPAAAAELVTRAGQRLAAVSSAEATNRGAAATSLRLLQQDLDAWEKGRRRATEPEAFTGLRIGPDAVWFELPGVPKVSLRRRVAIRRLFAALAEKRLSHPGVALGPYELFDAGWPGLEAKPELAMKRVYFAIWALRDMGLASVLLHETGGYFLDPGVPLLRQGG